MYEEKTDMTNQEMFTAIMDRLDSMESSINGRIDKLESRIDRLEARMDSLEARMDKLESRMDRLEARIDSLEAKMGTMESDMNMEFMAVRFEMDNVNKSLKNDISALNDKVDRLFIIKDVAGYEELKIQVEVLTQGYQKLSERIG